MPEITDRKLHEAKCNSIYYNLLTSKDVPACSYIREFSETERCDNVFNMQPHREELLQRLKDDKTRARIFSNDETEKDQRIAADAVFHYNHYHSSKLIAALTWSSKIQYHTIYRAERTFAIISGASSK
jgi:hypothetical protein